VIKDYNLISDYNELYQEALMMAKKLWERIKKEGKNIEFKY